MHFNTDQLRDYHFGLLEEAQSDEIKAHLKTCADCRADLEQIRTQFTVLDVLKEQPEVSNELVKSVLQPDRAKKIIPFRTAAILAAAASIAIIFGVLQVDNEADDNSRIADSGTASDERTTPQTSLQPDQTAKVLLASALRTADSPAASAEPTLAEQRAEKPFAPASNIELNVLPRRDDVQLTIYNAEDLTLVREKRKLTLKRGWNWLQFMWSNTLIDPTSLSMEPKTHADKIEITQLVYPPRLNELARWTIFSEFDGEAEFELTYFTSGLKWNAFYEATLAPNEQSMQLRSFVRIDNGSGEDYENAETRLVVGEINLVETIAELARRPAYRDQGVAAWYGRAAGGRDESWNYDTDDGMDDLFGVSLGEETRFAKQKEVLKQALSEYQLYTIEGRETIPDGWGKRLPSFDVQEIGVTNLYKFDEERWGNNTMRFLSFANTEECQLGETPLPNGDVRVFGTGRERLPNNPDGSPDGRALPLSYIGATGIKYIPVGEEVELELGTAQKVKVEPKLMRTRTANYQFLENIPDDDDDPGPVNGDISGWDEITNWQIEITNTRDLPVKLEITRATGSNNWEIQTAEPHEKQDAGHIRFTVTLEPRSKLHLEYELTVHHGTRAERN